MKTGNITDVYNELILTRTNSGGMSSYQFVRVRISSYEFVVYYCVFIPARKERKVDIESLKQYKQGQTVNTEVLGDDRAFYEKKFGVEEEFIIYR